MIHLNMIRTMKADSFDLEISDAEDILKGKDLSVSESDSCCSFSFSGNGSIDRSNGNVNDFSINRLDSEDNLST